MSNDIVLRPQRATDHDPIREITAAAFGDNGPVIAALLDVLPTTVSLVAECQDEVVGHVALSRSWVDARERLVDVLVLSPLSVRPDRQRSGIGTALVAAATDAAEAAGAPALFLEGDPGYYGARGFVRGDAHGFTRPSVRIPAAAFQVALLPAHEPWMTGALVYCEAFWATDCVGLRDPVLAQLE